MSLVPRINQAVLDRSKARARERGIEGYVAVKFLVREDGSILLTDYGGRLVLFEADGTRRTLLDARRARAGRRSSRPAPRRRRARPHRRRLRRARRRAARARPGR